jgi:hypothetical protein
MKREGIAAFSGTPRQKTAEAQAAELGSTLPISPEALLA